MGGVSETNAEREGQLAAVEDDVVAMSYYLGAVTSLAILYGYGTPSDSRLEPFATMTVQTIARALLSIYPYLFRNGPVNEVTDLDNMGGHRYDPLEPDTTGNLPSQISPADSDKEYA